MAKSLESSTTKTKKKDTRKRFPAKTVVATPSRLRWEKFINLFLENNLKEPDKVYIEAYGCSEASSRPAVSRLLKSKNFQEYFAKRIKDSLDDEKFTLEIRIVKMWVTRAFYDISDILDADGRLIESMSILRSKGLSCVIDGIDIRVDKDGGEHVVYKLADRDKALSMLKEYAQIIKEPVHKHEVDLKNAESLAPKIFIVQRRTVEEWQEFYKTISSGGPSQDKLLPSPPQPLNSSLAGQRAAGSPTSSLQISPPIMNTGVKRGEVSYFDESTKNSKR